MVDESRRDACSVPCDLCGSTIVQEVRSHDRDGNALRSVVCCRCGLVWTDPRPTAEQIQKFYSEDYRVDYKGSVQPKAKHLYREGTVAIHRYRRYQQLFTSGARVFDVGAGAGGWVYVLRAKGCDASGIEPNDGYAKFAADVLGLPVSKGFYQDVVVEPGSRDIVTMFHVLEHLEKPHDVMRLVRGWLRDKGLLLIEVPNVEAVCQQPHTQFHIGHLFHFNLAALERMGQRAGYDVLSRTQSADGGNIAVLFQKSEREAVLLAEIPGNYERVTSILSRHTRLRHFFSRYPYVRPLAKLAKQLSELLAVRGGHSPKQILDDLISSKLK